MTLPSYEYNLDNLLDKLYDDLSNKTDKLKKNILSKPNISIINKKTIISNIETIVEELNRKYSEIESFISSELNLYITQTGEGHMIINGIIKQSSFEKQIKLYIIEQVQCLMCKSIDTYIIKENRISYLNCKKCKAYRSIKK
jgi:translation initiation factor 2 subunit 2